MAADSTLTGSEPPEAVYTYKTTGAVDSVVYRGGTSTRYAYTIRDWVKSINNVSSSNGNFAAFYDYADNGNVQKAQFHNPQLDPDIPSDHRHYHQRFSYDALSRLTGADYGFGSDSSSAWFDVGNLAYDKAGNIQSLRRADETGALIDRLRFDYNSTHNRLQALTDSSGVVLGWDAQTVSSFG